MKSKVRSANVLILSAITFLLLVFSLGARADVVTNTQIPFSTSFFDPCNGHLIDDSGNLHVLVHITTDAAGGLHSDVIYNLDDYSAVDTVTGATLQEHENGQALLPSGPFEAKFNFPAGGTMEFTQNTTVGIEEQGSGRTIEGTLKFHFTVNANGTVSVTISETDFACK
jgi:hypothetical protein